MVFIIFKVMNKPIVNVLLQTNQRKLLQYHTKKLFFCQRINTVKTLNMLYMPVKKRQNLYFCSQCRNINVNIKRTLTHEINHIENEEEAVVNENDISNLVEATISPNKIRNSLYPNSDDPIINSIKLCQTVQEVFDLVSENENCFNHEHCSQAIIVLWDLQKMYEYASTADHTLDEKGSIQNEILRNYQTNLNQHSIFIQLLHLTTLCYKDMSPDALSCSFLYLRRMGVNATNNLIQCLFLQIKHLLGTVDPMQFPLTALSRFSIGLFYDKNLYSSITLISILPHIIINLDRIDNVENLRTLTISMRTVVNLLDTKLLNKYKNIVEDFIDKGILTSEHCLILLKTLCLIEESVVGKESLATLRKILLLFRGTSHCLSESQVLLLQKVLNFHLEPYSLMTELEAVSGQVLANYKIGDFFPNESYLCAVTSGKHHRGMLVAQEVVKNSVSILSLTEIIPFISTVDMETCNKYWMKLLALIQSSDAECRNKDLFAICSRYMYFSSNMAWYRNTAFEKHIIQLLTKELVEGVAGHIPREFAYIAAFLIAFDHSTASAMPKHIVSRLLEIMNQFSVHDCQQISKSLSIAMGIRKRRSLSQEFLQQFVSLDAALNSRAMQFLNIEENVSLHTVNSIMRAYIHRKGTIDTELFHKLVEKYEMVKENELSSRSVRSTVYNLISTSCLIPALIDKMVLYSIQQKDHIIGDTACKLIYACYYLGYTPKEGEEFFSVASQLITRDKERLTGLGLLQSSLALSFFNQFPSSLIQFIFTVGFLEHLDEEIKHCFAKAKYPIKIRQALMELNRAVCLDYPEAEVPWFHAKYCEEQHALGLQEHYHNSLFFSDVKHILTLATGFKDCVQTNVSSPYGYNIDLQICLDCDQKPVDVRKADASTINKVAILLQSYDNYTKHVYQLKGFHQMKIRHLEMMGYRVISISDSMWNAMYMAEPKAKLNHMKNLIWPSAS